jgi:hypothetical protein
VTASKSVGVAGTVNFRSSVFSSIIFESSTVASISVGFFVKNAFSLSQKSDTACILPLSIEIKNSLRGDFFLFRYPPKVDNTPKVDNIPKVDNTPKVDTRFTSLSLTVLLIGII